MRGRQPYLWNSAVSEPLSKWEWHVKEHSVRPCFYVDILSLAAWDIELRLLFRIENWDGFLGDGITSLSGLENWSAVWLALARPLCTKKPLERRGWNPFCFCKSWVAENYGGRRFLDFFLLTWHVPPNQTQVWVCRPDVVKIQAVD